MLFGVFDSQVSFSSQDSVSPLPAPTTEKVRRRKNGGEAITSHLAPSEPGKGVALVKKSSEVPLSY